MKKILLLCFICLSAFDGIAQQDPQYTQYMFNPVVVNPAYTGSREVLSAVLLYRHQWVGFTGAPKTQTLSMHAPLKRQKVAVGLQIMHDEIGPRNSTGYFLSYAYRLKLGNGKLSMGLRAGLYDLKFNFDKIDFKEEDVNNGFTRSRNVLTNFDFGTYYFTKDFYAGASFSHLGNIRVVKDENNKVDISNLLKHFTGTIGKAIVLNESIVFKPSMIVRTAGSQSAYADLNLSFLFEKKFWFGVAGRTNQTVMTLIEYNITDKFRMGYSYDFTFGKLRTTNSGSHEIFIGYDFDIHQHRMLSPRYF